MAAWSPVTYAGAARVGSLPILRHMPCRSPSTTCHDSHVWQSASWCDRSAARRLS
jgi:hypothetical protein